MLKTINISVRMYDIYYILWSYYANLILDCGILIISSYV